MTVPSRRWFDPVANATLCTGQEAIDAGVAMLPGRPMAADIETPGLTTYTINCITFAWHEPDNRIISILLDPREPGQLRLAADMIAKCGKIIFHNSPFDVPILWHHKLMDESAVRKVDDTIITARMAQPDAYILKNLESLANRYLGMDQFAGGMHTAFKAAGYKTQDAGYRGMNVESPIYRTGAMIDTVVTLRLDPILRQATYNWLTDHPFQKGAATNTQAAVPILERQHRANQILLLRSSVGLAVDPDYLVTYAESVDVEKQQAIAFLAQHHDAKGPLVGGASKGGRVVEWLGAHGFLPPDWPRSPKTRKLSARKEDLDTLDHPLAKAQRFLAQVEKIEQYITKVQTQYELTGRCHPQVNLLGASQSGRISVNSPEYHQFSEHARPIISDDGQGLTSIDWAQIEPVTMALMAHDWKFLEAYEAGDDLYEPIGRATGQPRKVNKVVLLAAMYGQSVWSMAQEIGHTKESAQQIRRQMFSAMPECAKWMSKVTGVADTYGRVLTVGGRILPVTAEGSYKSVNHCLAPETPVLTANLRHVRADTIKVGDRLVGFDEFSHDQRGRGTGKRFFRVAVVEGVERVVRQGVRITTSDGKQTVCSDGHQWLVRRPGKQPRLVWAYAKDLMPDEQFLSLGTWETNTSRDAGYLAGLYDGEGAMANRAEGHASTGLFFGQKPGYVMDEFIAAMDRMGLTYSYVPKAPSSTSPCDIVRVTGLARMLRTIGTLRPVRFMPRVEQMFDGVELHTVRMMESTPQIVSVEPIGEIETISIQTSTRTLVANGYLSHNCCQGSAADILIDTIIRMDDAGLGHHIQLTMHDELVVDTPAAEEAQRIMSTMPDFLIDWAGRQIELRTDRSDMGHQWLKV